MVRLLQVIELTVLALTVTIVAATKLNILKATRKLFKRPLIVPPQSKNHLIESYDVEETGSYLFQKNPQVRKITKSYLHRKFFNTCDSSCLVNNDREEISRILKEILPPVTKEEIDFEIFEVFNMLSRSTSFSC